MPAARASAGDRLAAPCRWAQRAPSKISAAIALPAFEALLVSTGIVAIAEIGDKTQLLSLVLAARFRRPLPILLGILVATLLNHGLAGALGAWIRTLLAPEALRWILALSFFAMAAWALRPDKADEGPSLGERYGVFAVTLVAFFLVEIGDKTQVATIALGAQYHSVIAVALGTTIGMMIANTPAVFLGEALVKRVSLKATRIAAATIFLLLGLLQLARVFRVL